MGNSANSLDKDYQRIVTHSQNKKLGIYNWFPYKEAFSRDLVLKLIDDFKLKKGDYILEPFCGIGTTLIASREKGVSSYGFDIIPICKFITEVKIHACDYDTKKIKEYLNILLQKKLDINNNIRIPDLKIINRAFSSIKDFKEILAFKKEIQNLIEDGIYRDIMILGLLSIVEKISNTKKDGAFLRIFERKDRKDIKQLYKSQIEKYIIDLDNLDQGLFVNNCCKYKVDNKVFCSDARKIKINKKFNAVITSPPYLNRYDYTRTYALELAVNFIKTFNDLRQIRYSTIRSHVEAKYGKSNKVTSNILKDCLDNIKVSKLNNARIPEMIRGYFEDMYLVLERIKTHMIKGGHVAFVVGTVRYSGVNIPADIILAQIGEQLGFFLDRIIVARIKGNSEQQRKKYGENPTRESIVIWKV